MSGTIFKDRERPGISGETPRWWTAEVIPSRVPRGLVVRLMSSASAMSVDSRSGALQQGVLEPTSGGASRTSTTAVQRLRYPDTVRKGALLLLLLRLLPERFPLPFLRGAAPTDVSAGYPVRCINDMFLVNSVVLNGTECNKSKEQSQAE